MTNLSPAAQAVKDAVLALYPDKATQDIGWPLDIPTIAAALRATAYQVVPDASRPSADSDYHLMNWSKSLDQYAQRQQTRAELLAIAAELENSNV
jgi:hypothetical protein